MSVDDIRTQPDVIDDIGSDNSKAQQMYMTLCFVFITSYLLLSILEGILYKTHFDTSC